MKSNGLAGLPDQKICGVLYGCKDGSPDGINGRQRGAEFSCQCRSRVCYMRYASKCWWETAMKYANGDVVIEDPAHKFLREQIFITIKLLSQPLSGILLRQQQA